MTERQYEPQNTSSTQTHQLSLSKGQRSTSTSPSICLNGVPTPPRLAEDVVVCIYFTFRKPLSLPGWLVEDNVQNLPVFNKIYTLYSGVIASIDACPEEQEAWSWDMRVED